MEKSSQAALLQTIVDNPRTLQDVREAVAAALGAFTSQPSTIAAPIGVTQKDTPRPHNFFAEHMKAKLAKAHATRGTINAILGQHFGAYIPDLEERIRVGNAACTALIAALASETAA